ncbi:retrovirus-related Pol polyprotein from type-1 retrotransposable element R2 [Trichonephila clavata]|uniref:Retrovirus-related Pol polyprotein from type-1 retrotransposable element R2 n=1 Tax=Trichonephila clavata TaxID=2740835 RepID=A0A8X6LJ19_TRICU|nr:retrovirus-related Pol polyprotein from type-1 retrotransposable element R2 [Trichonephila clavata]
MLGDAFTLLQDLRLEVNISKCATLHLSGVTPVGARSSRFKIGDSFLRHLGDHDAYTYLGKPVGFFLQKNFADVNEALRLADFITKSNLSQWQKLDALKTFFFPSLSFAMRTDQLDKTAWSKVDRFVRGEVKEILSVPVKASNHYRSANKRSGGCSIPSAAEDSDFYLIDTAFKLLTSNDEEVGLLALAQLSRTVRQRVKRQPSDGDFASFLSGCMEDEFGKTTNRLSNTWTNARKASARQKVTWSFSQGKPTISIGDETLSSAHRRKIMRTFHAHFQAKAASALRALPSQGKAMDCVALSPASTHFLTEGKFTRFADWRFVHKARLNLVPLNANKSWRDPQEKLCRRCGRWEETLPHVINHCPMHSAAWQKRHNTVLKRVQNAVAFKGKVISVNQAVDKGLRPDLVAEVGGELFIIDITIPFENRRPAFHQARLRKVEKYRPLIKFFQERGWSKVHIVPIIVGSLGLGTLSMMGSLRRLQQKVTSAFLESSVSRTASAGPKTSTSTISPVSNNIVVTLLRLRKLLEFRSTPQTNKMSPLFPHLKPLQVVGLFLLTAPSQCQFPPPPLGYFVGYCFLDVVDLYELLTRDCFFSCRPTTVFSGVNLDSPDTHPMNRIETPSHTLTAASDTESPSPRGPSTIGLKLLSNIIASVPLLTDSPRSCPRDTRLMASPSPPPEPAPRWTRTRMAPIK